MNIIISQLQISIQHIRGIYHNYHHSHPQPIFSFDKKLLSVTGNFILWQEISSCKRKFLSVAWNLVFCDENSFCDRKCLLLTEYFFLWQEISSWDWEFRPQTKNFFLWHEVSYPRFLSKVGYIWNILYFWCKSRTKVHDFWLYLKVRHKCVIFV